MINQAHCHRLIDDLVGEPSTNKQCSCCQTVRQGSLEQTLPISRLLNHSVFFAKTA